MDNCDILIVGGGPAGSSLAWRLRDAGLDVVIMDKKRFPRDKTCAGWITPAVAQTLQLDLEEYAGKRVLQAITGFRVGQIGADPVDIDYTYGPVSYGIRRCEFDHYLLRRSGARLMLDHSVKQIRRDKDHLVINDQISARLLVGAGGHFCPVARFLGAKPGQAETAVLAQEFEFKMTAAQLSACRVDAGRPELYFCPDLKGYGWVFKKGDYLNVGLGREDRHRLSSHVEDFRAFLQRHNRIGFTLPADFNGHAYLLYEHAVRDSVADGVLLIGDAAGLAYTRSGEGIRPAIESGLIAANVVLEANGDYRAAHLGRYVSMIRDRFGQRKTGSGLAAYLPQSFKQTLAGHIMKSSWLLRHVLINRWFLHTHQPALT